MRNELEGFVLFSPRSGNDMTNDLVIGKSFIRVAGGARKQCGNADYINVFFDENGKRMMIKKAEKKMPNVFRLDPKGYINSGAVRSRCLELAGIENVENGRIRFPGKNLNTPDIVIFDLGSGMKEK